jgi:multidrug resistance efflux pump
MKKWLILIVGAVLLTGCGQGGAAEPTADVIPVVQQAEGLVVAEAEVEPVRWSELVFTTGGTVAQAAVQPGDQVAPGDLLIQLDPVDAELAAQEALAAVAAAEAQLAQVKAGPRPEEIAAAEHQVSDAEAALARAAAQRDQVTAGAPQAEIAAAQAELAQALAEQRAVLEQNREARESNDQETKEQADYRIYAAREAVAAAEAKLAAAQGGAGAQVRQAQAGVSVAAAQQDVARAELALLEAGVTAEDVAFSQAAVQQAQAGLARADVVLERTEIRAPFAGTVTKVEVEVGETVTPGQAVVVLADLDRLQVRTTDLTELDVARVAVGQPVAVTVDGLPGVAWQGHVARIGLRSEDYRGDVVYPVYVELDEDTSDLRWGMTAVVEIEVE